MISQTLLRIVLILCLAIVLNVRNVHTQLLDFFNFDENNLRTLRQQVLPYSSGLISSNTKDHVDETNWHRVLNILQGQIKQWSFIESQLLEPNANIGIPEITIPLKHLSSTLEILGNILFTRDDLIGAMACLEKACPLMELLPISSQEDNFPANCFQKLRDVYLKLYDSTNMGGDNADDHLSAIISSSRKERRRKRRSRREVWEDDFGDDEELDEELDEESDSDIASVRSSFKFDIRNSLSYDILKDLNLIGDSHSHRDSHTINSFDPDKRIEELRLPYDHLRSEVEHMNYVQYDSDNTNQHNSFDSIISNNEYDQDTLDNLLDNDSLNNYGDNDNFGSEGGELSDEDSEKILHLLDIIVKKFVSEDDLGKREVFTQVESTVNNSISKNLPSKHQDIGKVLLDVMAQVMAQVVDNHMYNFNDELDQMMNLHNIDHRDDINDEKMLSHLSLEDRSRLRVLSLFGRASKDFASSDNMSNGEGDHGDRDSENDDGTSDGLSNNSHQNKRDARRKNKYRSSNHDSDEPVNRFDPSSLMDADPLNTDYRGAVPNINGDSAVLHVTFVILIVLTVAVLLIYQDMQRKKYARLRGRPPKKSQDLSTIANDILHFLWTVGCLITSVAKEAHILVNNSSSNPGVVMRNPTNSNSSTANDSNITGGAAAISSSNNSSKKNKNANDDLANLLASVTVGNKYDKKSSKSSNKASAKSKNGAKNGAKIPVKSDENKVSSYDDSDAENDDDEDALLMTSKHNAKEEGSGNQVDRQSVVSFNLMNTTNVDDIPGDFTLVKKEPKTQLSDKTSSTLADAGPHRGKQDSKSGQANGRDKADSTVKKSAKAAATTLSTSSPLTTPAKSILKNANASTTPHPDPSSLLHQMSATTASLSAARIATQSPDMLTASVTGVATIPHHLRAGALSALPTAARTSASIAAAPAPPSRLNVNGTIDDQGSSAASAHQAAVNSLVGLVSSNSIMQSSNQMNSYGNGPVSSLSFGPSSSLLNLGSTGAMDNWFSSKASQHSNTAAAPLNSSIFGEATFPSFHASFMNSANESSAFGDAFGETKSSFNAQGPLLPELSAHAPSFQPNTLQFNTPYGGFAGLFGSAGTGAANQSNRNQSVMQSPSDLAFQLGQSNTSSSISPIGMSTGGSSLNAFGLFPAPPPGLSRMSNVRNITLAVYCNFLQSSQVKAVKVTTNVVDGEFLLMKRSIGNSELWSLSLEVNRTRDVLVYKYFVEDADRNVWEEQATGHRKISLAVADESLTQEDLFSNPCKLKTM